MFGFILALPPLVLGSGAPRVLIQLRGGTGRLLPALSLLAWTHPKVAGSVPRLRSGVGLSPGEPLALGDDLLDA
jgi:hypothetical protein